MVRKLFLAAVLMELLYVALATRSAVPPSETVGGAWLGLAPRAFEATLEHAFLWSALSLLYLVSLALVSSSRTSSRSLVVFVLVSSIGFRATLAVLPNGFDRDERSAFLDAPDPLSRLALEGASRAPIEGLDVRSALAGAADVAALALAPGLLRAAGLPAGLVLLHGWNPLVVKELAGSARTEAFAFLLLLAAIRFVLRARPWTAAALFGGALAGPPWLWTALVPMARPLGAKTLVALALGGSAHALALRSDASIAGWLTVPAAGLAGGSLLPVIDVVSGLFVTRSELFPLAVAGCLWLGIVLRRAAAPLDDRRLPKDVLVASGSYLFLAPEVLPWAFVLFGYLGAFAGNRGWTLFTLTAPLGYLALASDGGWSFWLGFAQYFPPYAALVFFWLGSRPSSAPR